MDNFFIIGHRGACYYEPENTLRSFRKALKLKCKLIECDVRLSKDGKVVIIHDKTLDRTTNGKGLVKNYTLKELKNLNAGKGEKIPTLQEYINLLKKNKAIMVIELKEDIVNQVLDLIKKNKIENQVIIVSFHANYLKKIKNLNKNIKTGFLYYRKILAVKIAKLCRADYLGIYHRLVNKKLLDKAHKNNLKVFAYVRINENPNKNYLKKLIDLGLDGIALNKPIKQ